MKDVRALLIGVLNSSWSALIALAVVPLYLKYLGMEAYGLVGLFATTQAVLQLLDMGLAPTINREVARHSALGRAMDAGPLLHTLGRVYWLVAAAIAVMSYALSPLVAEHWLNARDLSSAALTHSVTLLGIVVACRWPIGLYQGVLMGSHRTVTASLLNMLMVSVGSIGAVAILAFVSPTIDAFFLWQAAVGLLYALAMRYAAWQAIGGSISYRFDVNQLKKVWRFSAGMSGVAVSAIVLMQLDKVLLSKILTLEGFGHYALAAVVASALYILLTPTFNVVYPRLSALVAQGRNEAVASLYRQGTHLLTCVLFPIAIGASVFSYDLLLLWTGNAAIARESSPVVSLFLVGTALNGAMHFPYALQLASGNTRLPLTINCILLIALVPLVVLLATRYGAVGGAASWAALNSVYLLVGTWLTHRIILRGWGLRWLTRDVLVPLALSILLVGGLGELLRRSSLPPLATLVLATLLVVTCSIGLIVLSPECRRLVAQTLFTRRALGVSMDPLHGDKTERG